MISKATRLATCIAEIRRGVTAVTHEPTIEPTVRLYLLKSFNVTNVDSTSFM